MPLVAITREMGSQGERVAAALGEALGCPVIYHEIIDYVADKMRLRKSHVIKLLEGRASLFERLTADQTSLSIFTAAETFALASRPRGAVFLSWGAAQVLERVPQAVRVRICAPLQLRCERVKQSLGSGDDEYVLHEIRISDEAHAAITKRHFGIRWRDAEHYDMVLNTERMSTPACVDAVVQLVRSPQFEETQAARERLADLSLEAHVRGALRQNPETMRLKLTILAEDGRILLGGAVSSAGDRVAAEAVAAAVPGVKEVIGRLDASGRPFALDGDPAARFSALR
jgi:cytidylate kinase